MSARCHGKVLHTELTSLKMKFTVNANCFDPLVHPPKGIMSSMQTEKGTRLSKTRNAITPARRLKWLLADKDAWALSGPVDGRSHNGCVLCSFADRKLVNGAVRELCTAIGILDSYIELCFI